MLHCSSETQDLVGQALLSLKERQLQLRALRVLHSVGVAITEISHLGHGVLLACTTCVSAVAPGRNASGHETSRVEGLPKVSGINKCKESLRVLQLEGPEEMCTSKKYRRRSSSDVGLMGSGPSCERGREKSTDAEHHRNCSGTLTYCKLLRLKTTGQPTSS